MPGHIDTHHHFFPKVYLDAIGADLLASVMPDKKAPSWSAEGAIAMMDEIGIAEAILSIPPGPSSPDAAKLLRQCNDTAADLRSQYPGRFGNFASLPLPDIDASLAEIAYSFETLKTDGIIILTNYDGKYLGDPLFAPIMDELNRRKAVAFIHPCPPPYELADLPPASVLEFPFDTTRTAASLIMAGSLKRWPDIRFILSHAGGALPFLAKRVAGPISMSPELSERLGDPEAAIRSFWFDTALSFSKPAMASLMAVADPERILFGTDYPTAPPFAVKMAAEGFANANMTEDLRTGISRGNAAKLLGRATA